MARDTVLSVSFFIEHILRIGCSKSKYSGDDVRDVEFCDRSYDDVPIRQSEDKSADCW